MRLTDVARELDLPPASAHSLLHRLVQLGYVEPDVSQRRYQIGSALVRLAVRITDRLGVERIARPFIEDLARRTREDVYLATPQRDGITYTAKVEGSESLRLNIRLGVLRPLHSTSVGKLYLAMLPDDELEPRLCALTLDKRTTATITQASDLRRAIDEIRAQGYALSEQETVEGICAIAIPITDAHDRFVAALSISVPVRRFYERRAEFVAEGIATANAISDSLGSPRLAKPSVA